MNWWIRKDLYDSRLYWTLSHFSFCIGGISISVFVSFLGIPIEIMCSAIALKISAITAGIKKYESLINKNNKKHDKIVLLA